MSLEWYMKYSLNIEEENGNIYGYVTDTKKHVQLENYMNEQGIPDVVPLVQSNYEIIAPLTNMWVDEDERGSGCGGKLLEEFIDRAVSKHAEAIVLVADTSESNEFDLVKWYESYGFDIIYGKRTQYPVMAKELKAE